MIPLTTKIPAICSLLQRVLEMEERATPGPWEIERKPVIRRNVYQIESADGYAVGDVRDYSGNPENKANAELIALSRNITKPQATALLGDIQNFTFLLSPCFGDKTNAFAQAALQSIADDFPDEQIYAEIARMKLAA